MQKQSWQTEIDSPERGFTKVEAGLLAAIFVIVVAVAVPVCLHFAARTRIRINLSNMQTVRTEAFTRIQTGLGERDSTTPEPNIINESLKEGHGWVAVAQVDREAQIRDIRLYAVDEIEDYPEGICPEKVTLPIKKGDETPLYTVPKKDRFTDPFAHVKPAAGYEKVYTVQVVITDVDSDILRR